MPTVEWMKIQRELLFTGTMPSQMYVSTCIILCIYSVSQKAANFGGSFVKHGSVFIIYGTHNQHTSENGVFVICL